MAKRKEDPVLPEDAHDKLELMPLGAGNEVGRSCVFMSYKGKNVLFDCGIHPAYSGIAGLPFFDEIDPSCIDVLLITHFHLDHAASLPYFLAKTNFQGRVFMTHATKAVYRLLLSDFVRVSKVAVDDALFTEQDIQQSMEKIEVIDFHQIHEVNGIKFWCYTAGHVLGAAMFAVDIAGIRVLYTGDYSREEDRHLRAAEVPPFSPELCVIESTFGVQIHEPREVRERRFLDFVVGTVLNGGRVLIPAFALGRAQELLLILDEHWRAHPEVQHVPLLYASPLARKTMVVYRTYLSAMNDRIREQAEVSNPFDFRFIKSLRSIAEFEDTGPAVVMASPGGLQSGLSRQLFDMWCQDARNTCLIPGYVVEGTLAKTILSEPNEVSLQNGTTVPLRMKVHYVSFAAHADYPQTSDFLEQLHPPNIVLVHGEATEMGRLRAKLTAHFAQRPDPPTIHTPKNCQAMEFFFKGEKIAKVVGRIAERGCSMPPADGKGEGDCGGSIVAAAAGGTAVGGGADGGAGGGAIKAAEGRGVVGVVATVAQTGTGAATGGRAGLEGASEGATEGEKAPGAGATGGAAGRTISGLLVRKGFNYQLLDPRDLPSYTSLALGRVVQRQSIPYIGPFEPIIRRLEMLFDSVVIIKDADVPAVHVHEKVIVAREGDDRVVLQWVSEPMGDMLADSIVALILQLESGRQTGKELKMVTSAGGGRGGRGGGKGGEVKGGDATVKGEASDGKAGALVVKEDGKEGNEGGDEKGKEGEGKEGEGKEESQEEGKKEGAEEKGLVKGEEGQGEGEGEGGGKWRWLKKEEMDHLERVLESMFGGVRRDGDEGLRVSVDGVEVSVRVGEGGGEVQCAEEGLRKRVREAVNRFLAAVRPIPCP
ncbi:hypothetical protein CLOM_g2018 [Closterium sp. NIES-68]|nr:hypothetical protein CLOM_g2018 [Closterium sp. NIES-68]GJP62630.1 hypothetical protein CLOP_g19666 [Closterium sp. NIES-67]